MHLVSLGQSINSLLKSNVIFPIKAVIYRHMCQNINVNIQHPTNDIQHWKSNCVLSNPTKEVLQSKKKYTPYSSPRGKDANCNRAVLDSKYAQKRKAKVGVRAGGSCEFLTKEPLMFRSDLDLLWDEFTDRQVQRNPDVGKMQMKNKQVVNTGKQSVKRQATADHHLNSRSHKYSVQFREFPKLIKRTWLKWSFI